MEKDQFRRYAQEAFRQMDEAGEHPGVERLASYSAGELAGQVRNEVAAHLAACPACSQRLAEFEQFAAECRGPAAAGLSGEWRDLRKRIWLRRVAQAAPKWGAIAAGVAAAALWLLPKTPERLLAQAYQERRSIEFRVAGAKHAPLRVERGGGGSAFAQPAALLQAQARLSEQDPNDPEVLRVKGEAELLARDAGAAVQTLKKALDLHPQDPRILATLGVAYALRGELERQPADYPQAIEALSESLRLQPQNPEAVFNRALVLERQLIYDQAIDQWRAYLKLDPSGPWSDEARRHIATLTPRIKARQKPGDRTGVSLVSADSADAETYLRETVITKWLPAKQPAARLADLLKQKHGDLWLTDVLAFADGPDALAGFRSLAAARTANQALNRDVGLPAAQEALASFHRAGNQAGELWARFEEVVALRVLFRHDPCRAAAAELIPELDRHPYFWLRSEARIELANCAMRLGRLDEGAANLVQARDIALAAGLGEAALRATSIYLDHVAHVGLPSELFAKATEALDIFWRGNFPPMRYYQVMDRLRDVTHESGALYTSYYLARSAVWAVESLPVRIPIDESQAHANLAAAACAVGEKAEARQNLEISDKLMAEAPKARSTAYYLEPRISLAAAELERDDADAAQSLLAKLQDGMNAESTVKMEVRYFGTLAEVYRRKGMFPAAVDAYRKAIDIGAKRIASLTSERERAGVLKSVDRSYRGLVAATLAMPGGDAEALRIWEAYRRLDAGSNANSSTNGANTVLAFAELPDGYVAWLSRKGQVTFRRLACSKAGIAPVVTRLLREASDPAIARRLLDQDAQQVYAWMVEPFASELLGAEVLVVELDGLLTAVPVQALQSRDGRFLSDRFTVQLSAGCASAPAALGPRSKLLVVANPALTGQSAARFPPLADSVTETQAARAAFPDNALLEGGQATVAALAAALPVADVVHFAGHGYASSENGALLLAPRDRDQDYELLRSADLLHQDWSRCRLAVLSACAAASGETHGAHNPDSLVRALSRAGVANVAASLWSVDSAATSELMKVFYTALAKGASPAHALRLAQRAVRDRPEWSHPYYWAGFQLYGTGVDNGQ